MLWRCLNNGGVHKESDMTSLLIATFLFHFFLQSLEIVSILIVTYFLIELLLRIFALG